MPDHEPPSGTAFSVTGARLVQNAGVPAVIVGVLVFVTDTVIAAEALQTPAIGVDKVL